LPVGWKRPGVGDVERSTHRGEYLGVAATGRQVTESGVSIYGIAGGRVAEAWVSSYDLGVMQQLGALPAPSHAE
jgi:predicted ester cyclase